MVMRPNAFDGKSLASRQWTCASRVDDEHGSFGHLDAPPTAAGATHTPVKRCKKSNRQSKTT
jgi:hypothetical protein